jgi:hypothetical protein
MKKLLLVLWAAWLLGASPVHAQTFMDCADLNGDSAINVIDLVYMLDEHRGGPPLPSGKGDIDFRQGYTVGDMTYLTGHIFRGYPEGGCPPFLPYTLMPTSDTLLFPVLDVPAGSGQLQLPIIMINHHRVGDMVLPFKITDYDGTVTLDSIQPSPEIMTGMALVTTWHDDSSGGLVFGFVNPASVFEPGIHFLATAYFQYTASPGGTLQIDTTTPRPHTYLNYVYGDYSTNDYEDLTIGIPTVVVTPTIGYPNMSVIPDTLSFKTFAGYPDPDARYFSVVTDGNPFTWFLTAPAWMTVDKTAGSAGDSVAVTPDISGLSAGMHYGDIQVFSTGVINSPQVVTVAVELKQQFPSLDANCDGTYNVSDIIVQINYMFKSEILPCNPCTGETGGP